MAYTQDQYFPPNTISGSSLVYYPALTGPLPSEAPFSSHGFNTIPTGNTHYQHSAPPYVSPPAPRRRSSNSYPYPVSVHDAARSPTRSWFAMPSNAHMQAPPHHYEAPYSSSMTRSRRDSATVGPDRHNRAYGRAPQDENQPRSNMGPFASSGSDPTNHSVVPQGVFVEPASSSEFFYRYPPIMFRRPEFPERGFNVAKMASSRPPTLVGDDDPIFKDVVERELKVQVHWPGYPAFEKRIKTLKGALPRGVMAVKIANMIFDFTAHLKQRDIQIERGQEYWTISNHPGGVGIKASDIIITQLFHCGGCHWQMELWVSKEAH